MIPWILGGLLGFGCILLIIAFILQIMAKERARLARINSRFQGAASHVEVEGGLGSTDLLKKKKKVQTPIARKSLRDGAREFLLGNVFWFSSLKRFSYFVTASIALTLAIWILIGIDIFISLTMGISLFLFINGALRKRKIVKRREAIDEKVPEVMEMIVRSLRIGAPISTAMAQVGRDLNGPLAEEFAIVSQEIAYGKDMNIALREMADRCENQDLSFFATAVQIQSGSGGNLAEVLARLAAITRGRFQLKRKIAAVTGEAKWSGKFLSAFPIFACLALLAVNPDYFDNITDEPYFLWILIVAGVLMLLNIVFMRYMTNLGE
jgi:tight adherence protein B